jgi:hypothetical protein
MPRASKLPKSAQSAPFNVIAVAQEGRLGFEAALLVASLRAASPGFQGRVLLAEPLPGRLWPHDPRIPDGPLRRALLDMGAEFIPFECREFGAPYAIGNKMECLAEMPDAPFLFLDTDTLITGDLGSVGFDFAKPSASMRREGTWPSIELYGPGYFETWKALYDLFGLDIGPTLDITQPDEYWQRYMYFNAGWFFGASAPNFGRQFLHMACTIRDRTPEAVIVQELYPWLDQIALPLVIHALGGARPTAALAGLDGDVTCHYRTLPLLYAREGDAVVAMLEQIANAPDLRPILRDYDPIRQMVYQNKGRTARALFDRANLPRREQAIRRVLKAEGLWLR